MIIMNKNIIGDIDILIDWQCPICMSRKYKKVERHYAKSKIFVNTKLVTCNNCLAKSVHPMPSEKDLVKFNKYYWKDVQSDSQDARDFHYIQALFRIKYLKKHLTCFGNMKILDVGAGHAYIYDILKSDNKTINYSVIECDTIMQDELRNKGIKRVYANWESIDESDYDIIILSHIVEHFREPTKYLKDLKRLLKKDGYMLVEVPNQDDIFKAYLGAHLIVFNKFSLKKLFGELDMNILDIVTAGENIENLRKSKLKKSLIRHFPQVVKLKQFFKKKITAIRKIEKPLAAEYKFEVYNNGRWIRLIAQNR